MIFTDKKSYRFEPDIEDNLKLPKGQRISALITRPDIETRGELSELEVARSFSRKEVESAEDKGTESKGKKKINFTRRQDTGRILREFVSDIRNVEIKNITEGGKETIVKITTGEELAMSTAFGIDALAQKFASEVLRDKLGEEKEKNSESPSSST